MEVQDTVEEIEKLVYESYTDMKPDFVIIPDPIPKPVFMFKGQPMSSGKKMNALRGIVYGDNGIGKTSTLACAMKPIIMDMEGNCGHIEADKQRITNFEDFHRFLDALIIHEHDYKTLILDSIDSVQIILNEKIMNSYTLKQLSFGNGSSIWKIYIKEVLDKLEKLSMIKGMNILFTAHWKVKSAKNPMTEDYDRYDLRVNEEMKTGFCNWVQFIVLALKEVIIEEKDAGFGKKKAKSIERRAWYTHGDPTYYGKNVFNLPKKIPMETAEKGWEQFTNDVKKFYSK